VFFYDLDLKDDYENQFWKRITNHLCYFPRALKLGNTYRLYCYTSIKVYRGISEMD